MYESLKISPYALGFIMFLFNMGAPMLFIHSQDHRAACPLNLNLCSGRTPSGSPSPASTPTGITPYI